MFLYCVFSKQVLAEFVECDDINDCDDNHELKKGSQLYNNNTTSAVQIIVIDCNTTLKIQGAKGTHSC